MKAIPKNIPIDMIFFLFWSSSELSNKVSYMNVVQTVTLAQRIDVQLDRIKIASCKESETQD